MTVALSQLRQMVRSRIGVPTSDRFQDSTEIDAAINLAVDTVESEHRWPWQERATTATLTAGDPEMPMPSDWASSRVLFIEDAELVNVAPADLYRRPLTPQAQPDVWAIINGTIYVRPTPDDAHVVTHMYYRAHSALENDSDTIDMPDRFAVAVVAKAAEHLSIREDDRSSAAAHLAEYMTTIARMRRDVRRSTGPMRVRVREGGWV